MSAEARRKRKGLAKWARGVILVRTPEWRGIDVDEADRPAWTKQFEHPPRVSEGSPLPEERS